MKARIELKLFCTVDRKPISPARALRGANTCSDVCSNHKKKMLRAEVDRRKCRVCARPSTPEERAEFKQWLRERDGEKKRGRPRKPADVDNTAGAGDTLAAHRVTF